MHARDALPLPLSLSLPLPLSLAAASQTRRLLVMLKDTLSTYVDCQEFDYASIDQLSWQPCRQLGDASSQHSDRRCMRALRVLSSKLQRTVIKLTATSDGFRKKKTLTIEITEVNVQFTPTMTIFDHEVYYFLLNRLI
jgi:hypothetical protein